MDGLRGGFRSFWLSLSKDDSRQADLLRSVGLYLVTRLALATFVWLCGQHYTCIGTRCTDRAFFPHNHLLNALFQWDAYQYAQLAKHGYYVGEGFNTTVPFMPGFPVLAAAVGKLFGSPLVGGIVVNHLASIAAAFLMARLVRRLEVRDVESGDLGATAREASLFWLASPLTIFFCVYLSESVFGLASVAALWGVVAGVWPVVALAGIAATSTRQAGLILVGAAALLAWERRKIVRPGWLGWSCIGAGVLGLVAMLVAQKVVLGDAFAWLAVHRQRWNRFLVFPWRTVHDDWIGFPSLSGRSVDAMYKTQELLAMALTAPLLFMRRRFRIPWAIWLLGVGQWLLPICSHSFMSIARYQAGNLYFALAIPALLQPRPQLRGLVWMLFGMVLAWYASTYAVGNWAS